MLVASIPSLNSLGLWGQQPQTAWMVKYMQTMQGDFLSEQTFRQSGIFYKTFSGGLFCNLILILVTEKLDWSIPT